MCTQEVKMGATLRILEMKRASWMKLGWASWCRIRVRSSTWLKRYPFLSSSWCSVACLSQSVESWRFATSRRALGWLKRAVVFGRFILSRSCFSLPWTLTGRWQGLECLLECGFHQRRKRCLCWGIECWFAFGSKMLTGSQNLSGPQCRKIHYPSRGTRGGSSIQRIVWLKSSLYWLFAGGPQGHGKQHRTQPYLPARLRLCRYSMWLSLFWYVVLWFVMTCDKRFFRRHPWKRQ